jgi:hypothetical protein
MLEAGTSFGAYEIVVAMGTGGMGTVLRLAIDRARTKQRRTFRPCQLRVGSNRMIRWKRSGLQSTRQALLRTR